VALHRRPAPLPRRSGPACWSGRSACCFRGG
jgi:hypothetical protein